MEQLKQQYQQLNDREKVLVKLSSVVVIIGLFYWLVWAPLNTALAKNRSAVESQQKLYSWVQQNANKAIQLRSSGGSKGGFNGSLPQAVNQTAAQANIAISRMQPKGEELQVWVDQVAFNDVLSWLQRIEGMGIAIVEADLAEADAAGYVKVRRLRLSKG